MFNKVVLVGNLTRDIEMRYAPSGTAIGATGIAVTRKFTTNGEKREETCFVDISFFGRTAEVANQYLSKGSKILVEGRLRYEQWNDQNGQTRSKHTIVVENMEMLGSNPNRGAGNAEFGGQGGNPYGEEFAPSQNYQQTNKKVSQNQAQNQNYQQEKIKEIDVDSFDDEDTELPF